MLFEAIQLQNVVSFSTLPLHLSKKSMSFLMILFDDSAALYQVNTALVSTFHSLDVCCRVLHLVGEIDLSNFVLYSQPSLLAE